MKRNVLIYFTAAIASAMIGLWFTLYPDRQFGNQVLHSSMETVEAVSVLLMALFLLNRNSEEDGCVSLALGFLGMGILNTAHAAAGQGNSFVFLRAAASLSGGLGFALLWLPNSRRLFNKRWLSWSVAACSLGLCGLAFLFPSALPPMLRGMRFSTAALSINTLAGLLFLTGSLRALFALKSGNGSEDLMFSLVGMLFGLSGLAFNYSVLWSVEWWYWHALRLIGSLLVLGLLLQRHLGTVAVLRMSLVERRHAEDSLRRSYERTKTIIDSMNDAVSLLDVRDFTIIGVNSAFLREYGYSEESEVVGRHCYELTHHRKDVCTPPDDICPLAETVRTGRHFSADHVHYGSRGEKKFVEVSTSPILDDDGRVIQVVHVAKDITGRKSAEQERELLLADIARSNKDLQDFASIASHDLKEPLRMVSSFVRLLERKYRGRLDEKADSYIGFAVDGIDRMQDLIDGLLAYSRVSRGADLFRPVDMNRIFSLAVSNLSEAIHECSAAVTREELPVVPGDETQLVQLLQNLIGNAIKYRKPGARPDVRISAAREGDCWLFTVRDNGIGIAAGDYQRIFQIFQRLHSHDTYTGAGIGLAVCKRIVERHQGRIWVDAVPGQGSSFFFTIPASTDSGLRECELKATSGRP